MKFSRNVKAISKLLLILLLLLTTIVGAILSYIWVVGYYINLGIAVPEKTTVSITNVTFDNQNTSYFFVTILNPSYSPTEANVTEIAASTGNDIQSTTEVNPLLPYRLSKGEEETFKCVWNWANYTGETVKVIAFITDGSGPTFEAETPLVDLEITDLSFDPAISVTHFNVTVQNGLSSVTYVNLTDVTIDGNFIPAENMSISVPYALDLNKSASFTCTWNWTDYQDKNVTIAVYTAQGYTAYHTLLTPKPVNLTITDILFNVTDTTRFNITVNNFIDSPTYVNITRITVTMENGTVQEITASLPTTLDSNSSVTLVCSWDWTNYREKNATITVYTLQDFTASYTQATTARVLLEIANVLFDVADPSYFNVTVENSEFSVEEYVNITSVTVAVENGAPENITIDPQITLYANASVTFKCLWNWTNYWNKEVSITVYTLQDYYAYSVAVTPSPVIISDVVFDLSDTTHFNVTVENSEFFSSYVLITNVTVVPENGSVQGVTVVAPTRLPYVLHSNESVIFVCSWNWTNYTSKNITVTVYTLQGYVAYYPNATTPDPVILILSANFTADTTYFNATVTNYEYSFMQVNITRISVTLQNGTDWNVTVEPPPSLPYTLYPNETVTFKCLWDWDAYRGETVIIKVETLEGYEVSGSYEVPTS